MTGPQADWLRSHKTYTPVNQHAPSGYVYQRRGILNADGTFVETPCGGRPAVTVGCIEVGVLTKTQDLERR